MAGRRTNDGSQESVEHLLQRRDIEDLTKKIQEGFTGVHLRQDTTNGKVMKATEDIIELKSDRSFLRGALAVLTAIVIPLAFLIIKFLLDK